MRDLFEINFDFLGVKLQCFVKIFDNNDAVSSFINERVTHDAFYIKRINEECSYLFFKEDNYDNPYFYCHEILHLVKDFLHHFEVNDEEMECYMLGYIVKIYTDFLAIHNKEKEELANDTVG